MAARLPMELQQRQALLEMRQENKRRESLLQWLATFVPKLVERGKAGREPEAMDRLTDVLSKRVISARL